MINKIPLHALFYYIIFFFIVSTYLIYVLKIFIQRSITCPFFYLFYMTRFVPGNSWIFIFQSEAHVNQSDVFKKFPWFLQQNCLYYVTTEMNKFRVIGEIKNYFCKLLHSNTFKSLFVIHKTMYGLYHFIIYQPTDTLCHQYGLVKYDLCQISRNQGTQRILTF